MSDEHVVIRPEVKIDDVRTLGQDYPPERREQIRKALTTLHANEVMAVNIYKAQITAKPCELNTQLAAAMFNEMTHMQDFQLKLYEYGFKPSRLRWAQWWVGLRLRLWISPSGHSTDPEDRHLGKPRPSSTTSAYSKAADWDEETRAVVEKDQADEVGHLERWKDFLKNPDPIC